LSGKYDRVGGSVATSQDVIAFRLQFSKFKSLTDADVAEALDEVDVFLDAKAWSPKDYPLARFLLTAHNLQLQILAQMMLPGGSSGSAGGGSLDTYLSGVTFGERHVTFGQRRWMQSQRQSTQGPGEEMLSATIYGLKFQQLRYRNFPPIMTV
jgi:Protein of unknown function (DUF4054)